jgi:sec-independent protein translocase protein TatA
MLIPMIGMPEGAEWLVILVIVVLVFGASKLPDLARGTGQALRIFKAESKALREDDEADKKTLPQATVADVTIVEKTEPTVERDTPSA